MKKYDYYRPSASSLGKRKKLRKKRPFLSYLKLILLFIAVCLLFFAGYLAVSKGYAAFSSSKISNWQVKSVVVNGLEDPLGKALLEMLQPYEGKPFTVKDAADLRAAIVKKYPQLRKVSVKRGLVTGNLTVAVQRRVPIAKFVLPGQETKYIDSDSTVYTDGSPDPEHVKEIPFVELEGDIPAQLSTEFVDLVQSTLALNKALNFAFLRFNLNTNTVKMYMPDGCIIDFGTAESLKDKARRAAEIIVYGRQHFKKPQYIDFKYFKFGKVFLTQITD